MSPIRVQERPLEQVNVELLTALTPGLRVSWLSKGVLLFLLEARAVNQFSWVEG
jgi:hypothetical protein